MSGEIPKIRETMDKFVRHMTDHGMPVEKARQIAQEQAIKHDRRERDKR